MAEEKKQSNEEIISEFFDEVPEKEPIIVGIAGPAGFGKTHFINTFPTPIIADTEARAQIVMRKFEGARYRKITTDLEGIRNTLLVAKTNVAPDTSKRNQFTFAIDSSSDILQMAESEWLKEAKKEKVFPLVLWAKVYDKVDFIFNKIRQFGFNAVLTQQLKEKYEGEKATGEFIPAGYKKIPYRVDIWMQLKKGIEYQGVTYFPETVVGEVLKDCWHNPGVTKPYLLDVSYDGIFKELKPYVHPKPGDRDAAVLQVLKELEKKTGIPMNKAKLEKEG